MSGKKRISAFVREKFNFSKACVFFPDKGKNKTSFKVCIDKGKTPLFLAGLRCKKESLLDKTYCIPYVTQILPPFLWKIGDVGSGLLN